LVPDSIGKGEEALKSADKSSEAASAFLKPRSVAVIGVSHDESALGSRLFRNILEGRFPGPVYAVNRSGGTIQSLPAYKTVLECPSPIDLALVVVPAAAVNQVAEECGKKGVKALVVITAGFAETGSEGAVRQQQLLAACRKYGMRLMGPNCSGFFSSTSGKTLNAQFTPYRPLPGRVGFMSQSGALGVAVFEYSNRLGLGMSAFISVGNEADVSAVDFIQFWKDDDGTDLIMLYLESLGNPRKFLELAREVSKKKPILVVKAGRSATGMKATRSHTGSLLEASDDVIQALFSQAGVIRSDTIEEMLDLAALLVSQPVPRGNKVGLVTNAGGAGILAADACEDFGLEAPEPSPETQATLRSFLRPEASVKNPIDLTASSMVNDSVRAAGIVAEDSRFDSLVVLSAPPLYFSMEDLANGILAKAKNIRHEITIVTSFPGAFAFSKLLSNGETQIPSYPVPRMAMKTVSRAVEYGRWLARPVGSAPALPGVRNAEARNLIKNALKNGRDWLSQEEAELLLNCYGIAMVRTLKVANADEVAKAYSMFEGSKVVLKGVAEGLVHKSEAGGVRVGLSSPSEVRAAAKEMNDKLASAGYHLTSFLVQPMIPAGPEMIIGAKNDRSFGPIIVCGAGGVLVELLKDVSIRIAPLNDLDAREMVRSLKGYPILKGYRGAPACDVGAFEDIILRVAALVGDSTEVAELDLNPIMLQPEGKGATVVDARVRVEAVG
jgi:acetyl coenzyme A synthetase (ADP forming)-like protein